MTLYAYEVPFALLCAECGFLLQNVTAYRKTEPHGKKAAYACANGSCKMFNQPHWFYYREVTMEDKVDEQPV